MQFPYLEQLTQWVRRGQEAFVVVDIPQLEANCRTVGQQYPPWIRHVYDLQTEPTLAVVRRIHEQLCCHVVIPTTAWISYLQLTNIPPSDVCCLNEHALWIESPEDWTRLALASCPASHSIACIPHHVLPKLIQCAPLRSIAQRPKQWLVDARGASIQDHDALSHCIQQFCEHHDIRCMVFHGEALLHQACTLWLVVRTVKQVHGRQYAIMSGGTNVLWDAGQRGNALRKKYPILFPYSAAEATVRPTTFCGPLCTPQDLLAVDIPAPALHPGDLIALPNAGSAHYRSPLYFISHPAPLEMLYTHGSLVPVQQVPSPFLSADPVDP